jgi:dihydrofolate synthase/folylpolyglutamate synthase
LVEDVEPLARQVPGLTWFEVLTALAFWHFAREQVEAAVIEVGLGGRLDATNVVQPIVVVITNISIDHTQLLGDTLAEIAAEKAAIIKPGVPVVSAPQVPEVQAVIERVAAGQDSPLILVGRDWFIRPGTLSVDGSLASIGTNGHMVDYHISLPGMVQVDNAAVALAALEQTRLAGLPITEQSGDLALSNTQWPGRLEVISHTPLILLDSAHNQHSAIQLRLALQTLTAGRSLTLIFGCMGDKDIDGMLRALLPVANRVILTQARHPRAAHPLDLLARAQAIRLEAAHLNQEWAEDLHLLFAPEVARAVVRAQAEMSSEDALCVAGSLAVAGEARTALLGKPEATPTT